MQTVGKGGIRRRTERCGVNAEIIAVPVATQVSVPNTANGWKIMINEIKRRLREAIYRWYDCYKEHGVYYGETPLELKDNYETILSLIEKSE